MQMYRHEKTNIEPNPLPQVSKKLEFYQVATGLILSCFLFGHLLLVSSILLGPSVFDGITYILDVTYIEFILPPIILVVMFAHFIVAARKFPFRQGEMMAIWKHAKTLKHLETTLWLIQAITAICLLALASTHIIQVMLDLPVTAAKSATRMQADGAGLFYTLLLICTWIHLGAGLFRIGVKYACINQNNRKKMTKMCIYAVLACMFLGLIAEVKLSNIDVEKLKAQSIQQTQIKS